MKRKPIQPRIAARGRERVAEAARGWAELRSAFARWTAGVTVIAVRHAAGVHGMTASAFTPVSVDPPLLLACIAGDAPLLTYIDEAGRFTVNVLSSTQRRIATRFADRFLIATGVFPPDGEPVIAGAAAPFVCSLHATHEGGDHHIVVGRVENVILGADEEPLLYGGREYLTPG